MSIFGQICTKITKFTPDLGQKTVKNLPQNFWLMLYGYGSSENDWSSARVVTTKRVRP